MQFRPCIDIHNGKVKQIVGGSLKDQNNSAKENFVSSVDAAFYARLYKEAGLSGGHIILLNPQSSEYYEATRREAINALKSYPNGLQIGGQIRADNAKEYIDAGASHVIVTSYVFQNGEILWENLEKLVQAVTKEKIVLDLSCRKKEDGYYIVTDRWQKDTNIKITFETLNLLSDYCDEFLIHAVDVEGKSEGIEEELVSLLGKWNGKAITYAGGVHNFEDLRLLKKLGHNKLNVTIGSALDIFGGQMKWEEVLEFMK